MCVHKIAVRLLGQRHSIHPKPRLLALPAMSTVVAAAGLKTVTDSAGPCRIAALSAPPTTETAGLLLNDEHPLSTQHSVSKALHSQPDQGQKAGVATTPGNNVASVLRHPPTKLFLKKRDARLANLCPLSYPPLLRPTPSRKHQEPTLFYVSKSRPSPLPRPII